ncbi:transient receptor potential cation channel subfamily V member 2 isoform X2 [Balaenoptera acutorostrata]|uniref:Transient receptor potential cation channel subfamily V member 2 isoform X2 n=1 Tax=Balaenoptera acutorostrata TaxID=9767 RepID=A0ABM3SRY2_BALAC|nr:transient receptor potential cation channel subfamily V member 2 isoform X2 [Balaenoptera acutorostrata]
MASPSRPPAFRLETSDGGQESGAQVDRGKLGSGAGPPPMESPFQGEDRNFSPQIKVNLSFRKGAGASQPDPNRFDRDRLFSAVARGVPEDLVGLPEYLRRTSKYLTDSEYTEGSTGKTCLMKAVLNLRDGTNACIESLLQIDRDSGNPRPLVNAQCTDEYYQGHSALHIAIEKRSLPCVKLLVENGADVHARACGQFFRKKSQETCFYFGEMPLSLAACTKQWDVVTYLLENPHQPASLQAADSLGNTALHALVMIADNSAENTELVTRMYDGLLQAGARLCPTVQLEDIPNLQGLTPLKLAAKEGKIEIFRHILQREFLGPSQSLSRKFTEWSYGPVRVSLYDLASVDSCEENSVLEIIAFHCQSPHRHRMVVLEPLNKLLQAKWNLLIPRFLFNFLCYLTYVSIFTAVTYHQPPLDKDFLPLEVTAGNSVLLLGHILILVVGANILMGQLWYFWRRRLFIWISFMDSYFEILLYVRPHSSSPVSCLGGGTRLALGPGPGAARRAVPGAVLPGHRVVPAPARVLAGAGLGELAVLHARLAAHGHLQCHDPEGHPAGPAPLPLGLLSLPFRLRCSTGEPEPGGPGPRGPRGLQQHGGGGRGGQGGQHGPVRRYPGRRPGAVQVHRRHGRAGLPGPAALPRGGAAAASGLRAAHLRPAAQHAHRAHERDRQQRRQRQLEHLEAAESHLCPGDGERLLVVQEEEAAGRCETDSWHQAGRSPRRALVLQGRGGELGCVGADAAHRARGARGARRPWRPEEPSPGLPIQPGQCRGGRPCAPPAP